MTIGRQTRAMGVRDLRANLKTAVRSVLDGSPVVVLRDGEPIAVMITREEYERCARIERTFWGLHALEVVAEVAKTPTELTDIVLGRIPQPPKINPMLPGKTDFDAPLRTRGLTEARLNLAEILNEVAKSNPQTLTVEGRTAITMIRASEYDRHLTLSRVVSWFKAAGLDLAEADIGAVMQWLRDFHDRVVESEREADEGPAIA